MDRRSFVIGSAASAAALAAPPASAQEAYPSHAITVINPFPPGGVSDTITRPLDAALEAVFKQPVVLENKAGAAGAVGAQFAAAAKPDGYTLLSHIVSISGFAAVDKLFGRTPKFTNADFIPIARIVADPIVMIVNDDMPYKTLKELVDDAKANPEQADLFSSSGLYGALAYPDRAVRQGGRQSADAPSADQWRRPGGYRGARRQRQFLHVADLDRAARRSRPARCARWRCRAPSASKSLPDVPTFKELGYDLEYYFWVGLFAPKGTPEPVIAKLRDGVNKAAHSKEFLGTLANLGQELAYHGPAGIREVLGRPTPSGRKTRSIHRPRAGMTPPPRRERSGQP